MGSRREAVLYGWSCRVRRVSTGALEEVNDQPIEPIGLVPLHPMGAVVEQMEFGAANPLKEF